MGFDISYHPINPDEMEAWYFEALAQAQQGDWAAIDALANAHDMHEFYRERYKEFLSAPIHTADVPFNEGIGFALAITHGFFRKFFYTRGTALSLLACDYPDITRYFSDWDTLLSERIAGKQAVNGLPANYCAGAYLSAAQVSQFWQDYQQDPALKQQIDIFYAQNLPAFISAIRYCVEHQLGLLEASEVITPDPMDLNNSHCYANLFNCDPEGALIYQQTVQNQLAEAIQQEPALAQALATEPANAHEDRPQAEAEKPSGLRGLWQKFFKK